MKKSWLMYCLAGVALLGGNLWAGKVVYPWRATTAFVKAGETFEVWYVASSGQTVNSVELKGPYNTVLTTRSVATGTWEYDHESGKTYNQKITVTVPANAPADRYDLVLKTSSGNETTPAAVKVLKDYKDYYYIVHMSDVHRYQGGYDVDVTLKKAEAVLDVADIVGAEMVWETGDQLYCHTTNNGETDNRINTMFSGKTGIRGLNSTKAAVFLVPGNHDSPKNNYTSDASLAVTMGWYNDKYGLGYFNFKYGNGRFMGVNSGMGSVPSEQRIAANAWLTSVGHGNLKLAAGHAGQSAVTSFDTVINLDMFLAGHNHFIASDNPHSINGKAIQYVANSIRDTGTGNFEYNLFRVKNSDGSVQVLGSTGSRVRVIQNHTIENINNPPSWIPMLELNFNNSNNGTANAVKATFINRHTFALSNSQVRFVMPKGNTYTVSKGTILQAFDGTTYHIVDVNVDLPANSTTVVDISVGTGTQVSVPNVINLTEAAAKSSITSAGLTVSGVSSNFHATVAAGIIYSQTPGAGTLVASNSSVALAVSKGPTPEVSVPNVINLTEAAAKSSITSAGLTVSGVSSNFHATVAAGIIYSQTPGAGTLVASNSSVALAVSKGPSNQPPSFVSDPFSMASANEGAAYSQSLSGKATDPEGGALTYSKISGPVWLSISSAGALTGTPGAADGGTNSFSVQVTDNGSLTDTATMKIVVNRTTTTVPWVTNLTESAAISSITGAGLVVSGVNTSFHATVASGLIFSQTPGGNTSAAIGSSVALAVSKGPSNQPPYFTSNPFAIADATVGTAYSQSISTSAVDPENGTKTYSKVSGPSWLSISGAGAVTGTPGTNNVGTNSFSVSVTDPGGLSATATMTVVVKSAITLPVVSFLAPAVLTVQAGTNLYVNVSATDPEGINRVRLYKDGVELARSEGGAPYEWGATNQVDPELQSLTAGSFVLTARATDNAGSIGEASVTITVQGGLPAFGSIITLKAVNGKYVTANYSTNNTLIANKTNNLTNYERFKVINATNTIALQCMGNNLFVSIDAASGGKPMVANRSTIGSFEKFHMVESGTNIAFRSDRNTNYVSAVSNGTAPLQAIQTYIGGYEKFTWKVE